VTTGDVVGEHFVLIDSDAVLPWTVPAAAIGTSVRISGTGIGDNAPAEQSTLFLVRALRPPTPVGIAATFQTDGSLHIGWIRRSRLGWA
jgi:hypothetical protein